MRTFKVYFCFVLFLAYLSTLSSTNDLRLCGQEPADRFDLLLRGGTVMDGSGSDPQIADVGLKAGVRQRSG